MEMSHSDARTEFIDWLVRAWDWASDAGDPAAERIAELVSHGDEPDYPLWKRAADEGILGYGELAKSLRHELGRYPDPPQTPWQKEINYSPVITLDEPVWRAIHGALGWVNRDHNQKISQPNFWLWSNAANPVTFIMRKTLQQVEQEMEHGA